MCCAYETVERSDRSLPLLIPMSEVAGRMAAQEGRYFLEKPRGGKGILLGGVPGVKPAKVFVIGAGVVGTAAARTAAGTGADVTICDVSLRRLTYLADVMPRNVKTLMSSEYNIREELKHADLVVGSVLIPGAKAPKLVTRDMLKLMEPGTVMVDARADQRHAALCLATGRQGVAARLRRERRAAARSEHRRREGRLPLGGRSVGASLRAAAKLIRTVSDDPAACGRPDPFAETGCFSGGFDRAGVGTCAGVRGERLRICPNLPIFASLKSGL